MDRASASNVSTAMMTSRCRGCGSVMTTLSVNSNHVRSGSSQSAGLSTGLYVYVRQWIMSTAKFPTKGGGVPVLRNFGGFSIYANTFCRRTTKSDVVTWGGSLFQMVSHAATPRGCAPALPNSGVSFCLCVHCLSLPTFGVLLYLCLHTLTQNDRIRHGNTYGAGRVLGQPRRCICTNASRGLSAIAEFLVYTVAAVYDVFSQVTVCNLIFRNIVFGKPLNRQNGHQDNSRLLGMSCRSHKVSY